MMMLYCIALEMATHLAFVCCVYRLMSVYGLGRKECRKVGCRGGNGVGVDVGGVLLDGVSLVYGE